MCVLPYQATWSQGYSSENGQHIVQLYKFRRTEVIR